MGTVAQLRKETTLNEQSQLVGLTADIACAHLSNNSVAISDVPRLIESIHAALAGLGGPAVPEVAAAVPAVDPKKSIKPEHLISLIDGRPYKMLRRHLATNGLTPDEYREKYGLPASYPMVSANYAATRRDLALKTGLGRHRSH